MALKLPKEVAARCAQGRPHCDTALNVWMQKTGTTRYAFAKMCGCSRIVMDRWANGQALPGLAFAFKIEEASGGAVPTASWLGCELGRLIWKQINRAVEGVA